MTIDVGVKEIDETLLEDIDEIMEDTMVQMFIVHPKSEEAIEMIQDTAEEHAPIFYTLPLRHADLADAKCIGYVIEDETELASGVPEDKTLFIEETNLTPAMAEKLAASNAKGIILGATADHPELPGFYLSFGPRSVEAFDAETLGNLSMDRIVLQSGYPDHGFESLHQTAKKISDVMFRPEQSIIARATKSTLALCGLR